MVSWWFVDGVVVVCRSCLGVLLVSWWFLGGASVVSSVVSGRVSVVSRSWWCDGASLVVSPWCLGGLVVSR